MSDSPLPDPLLDLPPLVRLRDSTKKEKEI
jgi:hypothetical protein